LDSCCFPPVGIPSDFLDNTGLSLQKRGYSSAIHRNERFGMAHVYCFLDCHFRGWVPITQPKVLEKSGKKKSIPEDALE